MTLFELVKIALDELYEEGKKKHGQDLDGKITEKLAYLVQHYSSNEKKDGVSIDYKGPATRFAYVFKYVAAHGDYIVQILRRLQQDLDKPLFPEHLRVSCIGGGPGSDIVGVLKYLGDYRTTEKDVKKVTCYLLDKQQAWADTWTEVANNLKSHLQVHANFQPLDVTKPESWQVQTKFLNADLFTLSYFISEVYKFNEDGTVSDFLQTVFSAAKPGALFLFDDSGARFASFFDEECKKAKMEVIKKSDMERFLPRYSEEKSELSDYTKKFEHNPKVQSQLWFRVVRKP